MSIYKCNWCGNCFTRMYNSYCYVTIIERLPNKNLKVSRLKDKYSGCLVEESDLKEVSKIEEIMLAKTYPDVL